MKKLLYFLQPYKNKLLLMIGLLFIQVMGTLYTVSYTHLDVYKRQGE